jgi:hypothetical protein
MDLNGVFGPEILNIPGIVPHLPLVVGSAAAYKFIHLVVGPLLHHFLKPHDPKAPPTKYALFRWNINTVSIAQSIINTGLSIYLLSHSEFRHSLTAQERILGYHEKTASALAISTGYFVFHLLQVWWDVDIEGTYMLAHAFAALYATTLAFVSFPTVAIPFESLTYLATPLIALQWCFDDLGAPEHFPVHPETSG